MPIYEFHCPDCGERFEELLPSPSAGPPPCRNCGAPAPSRLLSPVSPPGRQPRGAAVRDSESRRAEREAARRERLADTAKLRAAGGVPPPRRPEGR